MRVSLITSAAISQQNQRPFPLSSDASFRKISLRTPKNRLRIDHSSPFGPVARKDPEVIFPLQALKAAADQGVIGSVAPFHFSIYGGIQLYREIEERLAPALAEQLAKMGTDLAVFIPY